MLGAVAAKSLYCKLPASKRMKWVRNMKVLGLDLISGCSSG